MFNETMFNENYYLNNNPDVARAVENGTFKSGLHHFLTFGLSEGRPPNPALAYFNENYYLNNNPDVTRAVENGTFKSGLHHFLTFGLSEKREWYKYKFSNTNYSLNKNMWDAKAEFNNLPEMPSNTTPNSYDVLEVSPAASKQEITKAFTQAMKKRKYSTDIIAKARKSLTNSRERIKADYLRPILPIPKRFKRQDYSELKSTSPNFSLLSDYDNLEQMIEESQSISSLDQKIGTKLVNSLLSEDS